MISTTAPPAENQGTTTTAPDGSSFGRFERVMFLSLPVAIIVVPAWVVAGRSLMGGPGGWGTFLLMVFAAPILIVAHIVLYVMARRKNWQHLTAKADYYQRSNNGHYYTDSEEENNPITSISSSAWRGANDVYHVSRAVAYVLVVYYLALFWMQFFMRDGGDQGSMPSVAQQLLPGMTESQFEALTAIFLILSLATLVVLFIMVCFMKLDRPPNGRDNYMTGDAINLV